VLNAVAHNYATAFRAHFATGHDPYRLLGQDNIFLYQPYPVLLRLDRGATALDLACSLIAAKICSVPGGTASHLSVAAECDATLAEWHLGNVVVAPSDAASLTEYLREHAIDRVRLLGESSEELFRLTASDGVHIAAEPVLFEGRFELLHYLREQSRSINTHRYGNLDSRGPSPQRNAG
jgi:RHH-type proline utilization regulon transcriptional repressor/proline dehydrogenase/delta 1-pyrroline-5-carboxylate dehydrogenase